jgi:hypothetical protein
MAGFSCIAVTAAAWSRCRSLRRGLILVLSLLAAAISASSSAHAGLNSGYGAKPEGDHSAAPTSTPRDSRADVELTNTVVSGRVPIGGTGVFELALHDWSVGDKTDLTLTDTLPSGLVLLWVDGPCSHSSNTVACHFEGKLRTGVLPKIRIAARARRAGTFVNCASVSFGSTKDSGAAIRTSCAPLRVGSDTEQNPPAPPKLIVLPPLPQHDQKPDTKPGNGTGP